jgi:hypothetical protein
MEVPADLRAQLLSLPERFWGSVEIQFRDGQPTIVKTITTKQISTERTGRNGK